MVLSNLKKKKGKGGEGREKEDWRESVDWCLVSIAHVE